MSPGVFVIAEAGVNHNGSRKQALALIDGAKSAGADAVKFQSFRAEALAAESAGKAAYQKKFTGDGSQVEMLRQLELTEDDHRALADYCRELGIEFMSSAFDVDSMRLLVDLGIRRIKVPSGELTNHPFLSYVASLDLPIILSTGMASMDEIAEALGVITRAKDSLGLSLDREGISILHCTSNYPAAPGNLNLRALRTIAERFDHPVGYSDHSSGILASPVAVGMGAVVIEKHFTLDRSLPGPDHAASLTVEELTRMISDIRTVESMLGSAEKMPTDSELEVRALVRRSVVLKRSVRAGESLRMEDLAILRPGTGIAPGARDAVVGKAASRDLPAGTVLQWADLE